MRDRWMTVKDVAEYFKLSSDLVYKLAQQGKIPMSKVGSQWRFKKEKIDEWMENQYPKLRKGGNPNHNQAAIQELLAYAVLTGSDGSDFTRSDR